MAGRDGTDVPGARRSPPRDRPAADLRSRLPPPALAEPVITAGGQADARLLVRRAVTLDGVEQPDGDDLVLTGTVTPAPLGTPVHVVLERDGVRTVEAQGRTVSRGRYQVRLTSARRGASLVSVRVPDTLDNAAGESGQRQVVVAPSQADPSPQQP